MCSLSSLFFCRLACYNRPVQQEVSPIDRIRPRWWAPVTNPAVLLGLLLLTSFALRIVWLGNPHDLIFDEGYYVNAARVIDNISVAPHTQYSGSLAGVDPNREHGPLAKVFIVVSIRAFGDNPLGWRLPSVIFGTLMIAAIYWVARAAGASAWVSLGAASLMAADNLFLVHARIATIDIFAVGMMLIGVGFYLSKRPVLAGIAIGIGGCIKLTALWAVLVIVGLELIRWARPLARRGGVSDVKADGHAVVTCGLVTLVAFLGALGMLDRAVTDFPDPIAHTRYMVNYADTLTQSDLVAVRATSSAPIAPTSSPWEWLLDQRSINYYRHTAAPPGQPGAHRVLVSFHGRMNPFIIWLALPALVFAAWKAWNTDDQLAVIATAWFLATFVPLVVLSLRGRVGYIYYMLSVLPAIYLAIAGLLSARRVPRLATIGYGLLVIGAFVSLFPFRSWGGN